LVVLPSLSEADGGKVITYDNLAFPSLELATNKLGFVISSLLVGGRSQSVALENSLNYQYLDRYFTARLSPAWLLMQ